MMDHRVRLGERFTRARERRRQRRRTRIERDLARSTVGDDVRSAKGWIQELLGMHRSTRAAFDRLYLRLQVLHPEEVDGAYQRHNELICELAEMHLRLLIWEERVDQYLIVFSRLNESADRPLEPEERPLTTEE